MADRFDEMGGYPHSSFTYPDEFTVELDACRAADWPETADGNLLWRIAVDNVVLINEEAACERTLELSQGVYHIEAIAPTDESIVVTREIPIDDILVVSIGDSFAAGEGNKLDRGETRLGTDIPRLTYFDEQCHRSEINQHAFVAEELESRSRQTSVTYLQLACSGAEAGEGVLWEFEGTEARFGDPLPPQIDEVARLVCGADACGPESPRIDYLLISAGGNDVGFADILSDCVTGNCDQNDWDARVRNTMTTMLHPLYANIQAQIDRLALNVGETYLTLYPYDLFSSGQSDWWSSCVGNNVPKASFHNNEAEYLATQVAPILRDGMREAAVRRGWYATHDPTPSFVGHGMCGDGDAGDPDEPYIIQISISDELSFPGIWDGFDNDGYKPGHAHPNEAGHRALAKNVLASIDAEKPDRSLLATVTVTPMTAASANNIDASADYEVQDIRLEVRVQRDAWNNDIENVTTGVGVAAMTLPDAPLTIPDGPLTEGDPFSIDGEVRAKIHKGDEAVSISGWLSATDGTRVAYVFGEIPVDIDGSGEKRVTLTGRSNAPDPVGRLGLAQMTVCVAVERVDDPSDTAAVGTPGEVAVNLSECALAGQVVEGP